VTRFASGGRRLVATVVGSVSLLYMAAAPAFAQGQGAPSSTPQERAAAIATPGVVYLTTDWSGYVAPPGEKFYGDTDQNGQVVPFQAESTCTGFVANPSGYIVTAGHCVDDKTTVPGQGGKSDLVETAVQSWLDRKIITQQQADKYLAEEDQFAVEAQGNGSPPDRQVTVYQTVSMSGVIDQKGTVANVVDFRSVGQGDVALLKIETSTPMPALQVAPSGAESGANVVAIGYPGSVSDVTDPSQDPSVESGTVSGQRTVQGVPFTQIDAPISGGMSGGPVVDTAGRVLGTVSFSNGTESQPFNFMTSVDSVRELLSRNGVGMALSATDRAYRAGLAAYFAGHYHAAVAAFNQVLSAEPNHAMAQSYKAKAIALYPQEVKPERGGSSRPLIVIIIAAVMVVAAVLLWFLWWRPRHHAAATEPTNSVQEPLAASHDGETLGRIDGASADGATRLICASCSAGNEPGSQFCSRCGSALTSSRTQQEPRSWVGAADVRR
jgi:serine protease Do